MEFSIIADNIKCGGCANRITKSLLEISGVSSVQVEPETGVVAWSSEESLKQSVLAALAQMGYPETGTLEGLSSAGAKAKSFVSCAIGKVQQ